MNKANTAALEAAIRRAKASRPLNARLNSAAKRDEVITPDTSPSLIPATALKSFEFEDDPKQIAAAKLELQRLRCYERMDALALKMVRSLSLFSEDEKNDWPSGEDSDFVSDMSLATLATENSVDGEDMIVPVQEEEESDALDEGDVMFGWRRSVSLRLLPAAHSSAFTMDSEEMEAMLLAGNSSDAYAAKSSWSIAPRVTSPESNDSIHSSPASNVGVLATAQDLNTSRPRADTTSCSARYPESSIHRERYRPNSRELFASGVYSLEPAMESRLPLWLPPPVSISAALHPSLLSQWQYLAAPAPINTAYEAVVCSTYPLPMCHVLKDTTSDYLWDRSTFPSRSAWYKPPRPTVLPIHRYKGEARRPETFERELKEASNLKIEKRANERENIATCKIEKITSYNWFMHRAYKKRLRRETKEREQKSAKKEMQKPKKMKRMRRRVPAMKSRKLLKEIAAIVGDIPWVSLTDSSKTSFHSNPSKRFGVNKEVLARKRMQSKEKGQQNRFYEEKAEEESGYLLDSSFTNPRKAPSPPNANEIPWLHFYNSSRRASSPPCFADQSSTSTTITSNCRSTYLATPPRSVSTPATPDPSEREFAEPTEEYPFLFEETLRWLRAGRPSDVEELAASGQLPQREGEDTIFYPRIDLAALCRIGRAEDEAILYLRKGRVVA